MPDRQHERVPEPASSDRQPGSVVLDPPTQDQQEYLQSIARTLADYDPNTIIGGPPGRRG